MVLRSNGVAPEERAVTNPQGIDFAANILIARTFVSQENYSIHHGCLIDLKIAFVLPEERAITRPKCIKGSIKKASDIYDAVSHSEHECWEVGLVVPQEAPITASQRINCPSINQSTF